MILQLRPGLRLVWRPPDGAQVGLSDRRGLVLDGLDDSDRHVLQLLVHGVADERVRRHRLVPVLADAGLLITTRSGRSVLAVVGGPDGLQAGDAAAWSCIYPRGGRDAWDLLAARRHRRVLLVGRPGWLPSLARLLTDCGVGQVDLLDSPPAQHGAAATTAHPDVAVLVFDGAADADSARRWLRDDVPHLAVVGRTTDVVLGPFVLPGTTACLRCLDLHRADADPLWPHMLSQLLGADRPPLPWETGLAAVVAGLVCTEVLVHLDGVTRPATHAATLEVGLPHPLPQVHRWTAHPDCGCRWGPPQPDPEALQPTDPVVHTSILGAAWGQDGRESPRGATMNT